jgi:hypothetical protein
MREWIWLALILAAAISGVCRLLGPLNPYPRRNKR